MKCDRCNRNALPTKEFKKGGTVKTRLCGNCEAITIATHGEDFLSFIRGSADGGIEATSDSGDPQLSPPAKEPPSGSQASDADESAS